MVENTGLENRRRFIPTVGSNPTPSANSMIQPAYLYTFIDYYFGSAPQSVPQVAGALVPSR